MSKFERKHKNLILLILGVIAALILIQIPGFHELLLKLGNFGYLGAFIAGMLFTSTFTLTIGAVILLNLAGSLPFFPLVVISALGAVLCDFLIFKFVKNGVNEEIKPLYQEVEKLEKKAHLKKILHTKYFAWTLPVLGALVIVSPLPDELGVSLLGISEIKILRFILISFCSHGVGMTLLISAATIL